MATVTINYTCQETIEAMLEAENIAKDPNQKKYSDTEEALAELKGKLDCMSINKVIEN